ncbi:MAG: fructose-6-phosphate aldolase [Myxococcota bacterium]|nr:fructose-6-phosphate aldolase [Myxococcota bacterium]
MKIFIDSAVVEEISEAESWGIIDGVTTNPSLIAKSGRDFKEVIHEITSIVDGPISAETVALDSETMLKDARDFATWHPNIVVKIPLTAEGLKAVKILSAEGIKTNVTLCFSAAQGLLAAKAGATYVSPFMGRLDDISHSGLTLIEELVELYEIHGFATEVLAASIRSPRHVVDAALVGAHVATIPFKVLGQLVKHPLTDRGLEQFMADWETANG